jgi:signal transduction histidine kinase
VIDFGWQYHSSTQVIQLLYSIKLGANDFYRIIQVSDTGTGIPEEHLASLFERHSPLRQSPGKAHDGGGLGLLISKRILQLHGSAIKAMNTNKGAMFMFSLAIKPNSK